MNREMNVPSKTQKIINDIKNYIDERGTDYAEWYVGICADPYGNDFVTRKMGSLYWMYVETGSPQIARDVAIYCVKSLKTDGDMRGQATDNVSTIVYAYKKTARVTGKTTNWG
jgi:hypothetical protein